MDNRKTRHQTFLEIALLLSGRASCNRLHVGAIIVKDKKHIISSGCNGPRAWTCDERGCDTSKPCNHAIHAEDNAIAFAKEQGIDLRGCTLYCTHQPCMSCAILIVKAGISRVVYLEPYRLVEGLEYLKQNKVQVEQHEPIKNS